MSDITMECCPPSAWNGVRDDGGTLSGISVESCPPSRGIRMQTVVGTIVRINSRTATIDPGDGTQWRVGFSLLRHVLDV